ncbi:MAG: sensor histidine kinase, partial [Actinomycetota bacterium]
LDFAARISLGFELTAKEEARKAAESALRSKSRQLASIAALGAAAMEADTTKALFQGVARRAASILEVELVRVMEAAPDGSKLVTRAAVGFELSKGREVTPDEDAVAAFAVRQGPIIVRDLSAEGFGAAMLTANGVVSGVEAPITSPAGAIGLVGAFSRTERRFTDDDVIYLKGVAALAGVAVARLRAEALFHQSVQGERDRRKTTRDDLEREVAERTAQLKAAVDELEAFTYSVSHDLRAPLRAVRGFAGILLEEQTARLDDEGIRQLHVIADSAERMGDLIDDLLSLSRIGRREPNLGEVDLNAAADGAIATCKQAHSEHPALVRRSELGRAIADRGLLDHLFLDLVDNAFKFTSKREDPVIEIGLVDSPEPDEAVVCVRDNGAGFDQRHIDQLFQPFHRLHQVADFPGTGIGLAVVARVAQKIGARVWAEGQPDRGATFFVALKKGGSHG